jgi:3-deoxy-D-manno-octulosonic-acid transferase
VLGTAAATALIPPWYLHHVLCGRDTRRIGQRLGFYSRRLKRALQRPTDFWLHAVSVGEVGAALPIVNLLNNKQPVSRVVLSTATEQGLSRAKTLFGENFTCFYSPIDLQGPNRACLQMVKPKVLALLETEIWPNLIINAHRRGVKVAIVNGRISVRSIGKYFKIKRLMRHTLAHVDRFSMISSEDAERIISLGALPERVVVNGNAKFDSAVAIPDDQSNAWAARLYQVEGATPVFVAGSTRSDEERWLLDAFIGIRRRFPQTLLIIAPRHLSRVPQIEDLLRERGLTFQRRSQIDDARPRKAPVVLLDSMGELGATYSIASLVFCGGSLVPKGGQNLLEPAMWGKPIMHGRSMEDFADARDLILKAGGSVVVRTVDEIQATALAWLKDPAKARTVGAAARGAILSHAGAAAKHAKELSRLLPAAKPYS